ncbi:hypothetical protein JG550_001488 [Curtobacterium flaccumfaciens pv. flaccumfaciens]|uniref:rhamnosyltransferase WsaF family glycosyltransferase n=1 Tax=Curtobacterium flaccumfaciens TaxID=2035 RepID=UPI001AD9FAE7|nr:hypothetical protein [Curtobacterium flaccumfaciens]MBO9047304.1 hypothetical protein [Curtobacterium flaccumfaciens pv. flaccumfaciens]QTR92158.1 hypothetical protein JG550_001488 [Curtobacterium flaccumfaciens pv. flaccumfaciens]
MNFEKARRLVSDLVRVNERYARDGHYRNDVRERLGRTVSRVDVGVARRERDRAPLAARPFDGLVETSLSLAGIRTVDRDPEVVLVVDELREGAAFAGVQTALAVALALGDRLGRRVRVVMVRWTTPGNSAAAAEALVADRFPESRVDGRPGVRVVRREDVLDTEFGRDDVWVATHWKTAHPIDVAVAAGVVPRHRVVYLVQDYEPGFSPWSTEYAVAASTYRAGFRMLVNSEPLRRYLADVEGLDVPSEHTFAPHLDLELLERVAAARGHEDVVRVLFYGRPSKHRNLFRLGVAALRVAVQELADDGIRVEFHSAGEQHGDVELDGGRGDAKLVSHGTMPWDDYFRFIASTNVVLSLQHSPHPSHPPFDGAVSGARVVTNEFRGTRAHLHSNLEAVPADARSLGLAVADAVRQAAADGPTGHVPLAAGVLGGPLESAVDALARALEAEESDR